MNPRSNIERKPFLVRGISRDAAAHQDLQLLDATLGVAGHTLHIAQIRSLVPIRQDVGAFLRPLEAQEHKLICVKM